MAHGNSEILGTQHFGAFLAFSITTFGMADSKPFPVDARPSSGGIDGIFRAGGRTI
jgi:hypothetical protein